MTSVAEYVSTLEKALDIAEGVETVFVQDHNGDEVKVRRVRSAEGARRFGAPIGSIIRADGTVVPPKGKAPAKAPDKAPGGRRTAVDDAKDKMTLKQKNEYDRLRNSGKNHTEALAEMEKSPDPEARKKTKVDEDLEKLSKGDRDRYYDFRNDGRTHAEALAALKTKPGEKLPPKGEAKPTSAVNKPWKDIPADYKATRDGKRYVMVNGAKGTEMVLWEGPKDESKPPAKSTAPDRVKPSSTSSAKMGRKKNVDGWEVYPVRIGDAEYGITNDGNGWYPYEGEHDFISNEYYDSPKAALEALENFHGDRKAGKKGTKSLDEDMDEKRMRRIRTPEGARRFGAPIGSIINNDGSVVKEGDLTPRQIHNIDKEQRRIDVSRRNRPRSEAPPERDNSNDAVVPKGTKKPTRQSRTPAAAAAKPDERMEGLPPVHRKAVEALSSEQREAYFKLRKSGKSHTATMAELQGDS